MGAVTAAVAATLVDVGLEASIASVVAAGVVDAAAGSALGAGMGFATGGDPGMGALGGAFTGGAIGGLGGVAGSALGSTGAGSLGAIAGDMMAGAGGGALGSLVTGSNPLMASLSGAGSGAMAGVMQGLLAAPSPGTPPLPGDAALPPAGGLPGAGAVAAPGSDIYIPPTVSSDAGSIDLGAGSSAIQAGSPGMAPLVPPGPSSAPSAGTDWSTPVVGSLDNPSSGAGFGSPGPSSAPSAGTDWSTPVVGSLDNLSNGAGFTGQVMDMPMVGMPSAQGLSNAQISPVQQVMNFMGMGQPPTALGDPAAEFGADPYNLANAMAPRAPQDTQLNDILKSIGISGGKAGAAAPQPGLTQKLAGMIPGVDPGSTTADVIAKGIGFLPAAGMMGGAALMSQQPPKFQNQVNQQAEQAMRQGQALINAFNSGTLPPGLQQSLTSAAASAKASVRSQYARQGMSGSSAEAQDLAAVDARMSGQGGQMLMQLLQAGMSQENASSALYQSLMNSSVQQDQGLANGMTKFASSMAGGGDGTTIVLGR